VEIIARDTINAVKIELAKIYELLLLLSSPKRDCWKVRPKNIERISNVAIDGSLCRRILNYEGTLACPYI